MKMNRAIFTIASPEDSVNCIALMKSSKEQNPDFIRYIFFYDVIEIKIETPNEINIVCINDLKISQYKHYLYGLDNKDIPIFILPYIFKHLQERGIDQSFYISATSYLYSSLSQLQHYLEKSLCILIPYHTIVNPSFYTKQVDENVGNINPCFLVVNNLHSYSRKLIQEWIWNNEYLWNSRKIRNLNLLYSWLDKLIYLFDDIIIVRSSSLGNSTYTSSERFLYKSGDSYYVNEDKLLQFVHTDISLLNECQRINDKTQMLLQEDYRKNLKLSGKETRIVAKEIRFASIPAELKRKYRDDIKYRIKYENDISFSIELIKDKEKQKIQLIKNYILKKYFRLQIKLQVNLLRSLHLVEAKIEKLCTRVPKKHNSGVNLVGYARSDIGIGQALRSFAGAIEAVKEPFCIINTFAGNESSMNDFSYINREKRFPENNITMFFLNPPEFLRYWDSQQSFFVNSYRIGVWFWEIPEINNDFFEAIKCIDEIWASSKHMQLCFSQKTNKPVKNIPLCVSVPKESRKNRSEYFLPANGFLFLSMYDMKSCQTRKNPEGVISAFKKAFPDNKNCYLIIKVNNSFLHNEEFRRMKILIENNDQIIILNENMDRMDVYDLINCCDVFISLHRAEGFGLGMAEAMAMGKPVVATNWSGNIDYMTTENSYLVNYSLVQLDKNYGPYRKGSTWAEPDIEHASMLMRKIVEDPKDACERGKRARKTMEEKYSQNRIGDIIKKRLREIEKTGIAFR